MASHDRSQLQAGIAALETRDSSEPHQLRRYTRFNVDVDGWLHPSPRPGGLEKSIPVVVRDISRVGAGVVTSRRLDACDAVPLSLCDGSLSLGTISAFVRHCHPIPGGEGTYLVGLDFGIEAGLLMSLGISPVDILHGDQAEADKFSDPSSFCAPDDLPGSDAA